MNRIIFTIAFFAGFFLWFYWVVDYLPGVWKGIASLLFIVIYPTLLLVMRMKKFGYSAREAVFEFLPWHGFLKDPRKKKFL